MDFEEKELSTAGRQFLDTLNALGESISFCASGARPLVLPGLMVDGIGEVSLPVSKKDACSLIELADQAPYGRGEETIVDTDVRRVWQLEPDLFRLENPNWNSFIEELAKSVKTEFGLRRKVTASLYKMLVYEKGSFFAPHRDTEKAPSMFATLIVCLPSKHEGGQLIVSHAGQSQVIDFSGKISRYDLQYAAFYADCEHEVRPVTSGYRVCLVYNLSVSGRKKQPVAPEFGDSIASATKAIAAIFAEDDERDMIIVPLLHQYSEAGLIPDIEVDVVAKNDAYDANEWDDDEEESDNDISGSKQRRADSASNPSVLAPLEFKGADRARTDVLKQAAASTNCRVFVALLTHWQSGYPDYSTMEYEPYQRGGRHGYQDISAENQQAEFEAVYDESMSLKHWYSLDGERQPFDEIFIDEGDVVSDEEHHERPYQQEVSEATGNAGASMERWYHQAVVVLWPDARHFQVLASQGAKNSVPALHELVVTTENPAKSKDCRLFAGSIINYWQYPISRRRGEAESLGTSMMRSLVTIGNAELARKFFEQVLPNEYGKLDGELLVTLAGIAGWKAIETPLLSFFHAQSPDDYHADLRFLLETFGVLFGSKDGVSASRKQVGKSLLKEVTAMLAQWEIKRPVPDDDDYYYGTTRQSDFIGVVAPLMRGICTVGTRGDLKHLLARIAAMPQHYDLHKVLIPAVTTLAGDKQFAGSSKLAETAVHELRRFCLDQLKQRTIKQPEPPKNWKRVAKLDCDCADCQELAQFLQDKDAQVHHFPRNQALRQHLHQQIERHRIDCTHVTRRQGRPYTLVCTKNQASFERALKQYRTDCKLLEQLDDG